MKIYAVIALAALVGSLPAAAQNATSWTYRDPAIAPTTGFVLRRDIPNEYMEVNVARGTVRVEGSAADRVEWEIATSTDSLPGVPTNGPVQINYRGGYPGSVGTTRWNEHFSLEVGPVLRETPAKLAADVRLRVPRTLKILHVNVRGAGKVVLSGFDGEVTVMVDSGQIAGSKLGGAVMLEARNGGVTLDVDASPFQTGPVSLLSHNGSIDLFLPPDPSVTLDLKTDCGEIHRFPMTVKPAKGQVEAMDSWISARGKGADCSLRPKSLPPLEGVSNLRYALQGAVGTGALLIQATALQGDINIKKK